MWTSVGSPIPTLRASQESGLAFVSRPFYVEARDKSQRFVLEAKPAELAAFDRVTKQVRRRVEADRRSINPLEKARQYAAFLTQIPGSHHADAARHFRVSRARVCQLLALLALPAELIASIDAACADPAGRRYFTEKRLRPLAALHDPGLVKQRFEILWEQFTARTGRYGQAQEISTTTETLAGAARTP